MTLEDSIKSDSAISYLFSEPCRGIECGDGWSVPILKACYDISYMDKKKKVRIDLIKEKFGGVRFHYHTINTWFDDFIENIHYKINTIKFKLTKVRTFYYSSFTKKVDEIVHQLELNCWCTCEECGDTGKTVCTSSKDTGWRQTLCDECRNKVKMF